MRMLVAIFLPLALATVSDARAQTEAETTLVLRTALSHVAATLPQEERVLDPRRRATTRANGPWESGRRGAAQLSTLASALHATVDTIEARRQCTGPNPSDCHLSAASAVIASSDPRISGDTATVVISIWEASPSARAPIAERDLTVTLVRRGAAWTVVEERVLRIT
jgi:hypothetical protein